MKQEEITEKNMHFGKILYIYNGNSGFDL